MLEKAVVGLFGLAVLAHVFTARKDVAKVKKSKGCGAKKTEERCIPCEDDSCVMEASDVQVEIHYCLRCKWGLRAGWMAQEILNTFEREVRSVNLVPSMEGGTYKIVVICEGKSLLAFDRKVDGGFPQPKEMKQKIRDLAFPDRALGKCLDAK